MTKPRFSPEYKTLMQGWQWQFIRALVFNRDNWTCQHCGIKIPPGEGTQTRHLQADHKRYPSKGAPLSAFLSQQLSDYQTLCNVCHGQKTAQSRSKSA